MRLRTIVSLVALSAFWSPASGQEPYDYSVNCQSWPAVEGEYAVGTLEFELTDSIRSAQYAPEPTGHRRIYVRAWYPAEDVSGLAPRPYLTKAEVAALPGFLMTFIQQPEDALRGCADLPSNGYPGATPAPGEFPVVGFNHGYVSYPAQQTALFEHLAANGYVVLAVGHPYESSGIIFPNGDVQTISPRITQDLMAFGSITENLVVHFGERLADRLSAMAGYLRALRGSSLGQLAPVWQSDVYFVLDRLEAAAIPMEVERLAGAIDFDRRAYMGMSYGGYIAAMLAQGDSRARAAANLDGGSWTYELIDTDLRTPFLMLCSDATGALAALPPVDGVYTGVWGPQAPTAGDLAYERLAAAGLRGDVHRIMIPGVQHIAVSDLPEVLHAPSAIPLTGRPEMLGKFTRIQNDLVLGFFDRYVKGIENDFPKPAFQAFPELRVRDLTAFREEAKALGLEVRNR